MNKKETQEILQQLRDIRSVVLNSDIISSVGIVGFLDRIIHAVKVDSDPFLYACGTTIQNCLNRAGVFHYEDVLNLTREDLENIAGLGPRSITKLEYLMSLRGDSFKTEIPMLERSI